MVIKQTFRTLFLIFVLVITSVALVPAHAEPTAQDIRDLTCNAGVVGTITNSQLEEVWRLNASKGQVLDISMGQKGASTLDPMLIVEGPGGRIWTDDNSGTDNSAELYIIAPADGDYYIVATASYNGLTTGEYNLYVDCQFGGMQEDGMQTGGQINCPSETHDALTSNNYQDTWQIALQKDSQVTVLMTRTYGDFEPSLWVEYNGTRIDESDPNYYPQRDDIATVVFTPTTDGTYTIFAARRNLGQGHKTGRYTLLVACAPPSEPLPAQSGIGGELNCGVTSGDSLINANPEDHWRFSGSAGDVIGVEMVRTSHNLEPTLFLWGPDGSELTSAPSANNGTTASIVGYTLPVDGTYTVVAARAGRLNGTSQGNYHLVLICQAATDVPAPPTTPTIAYGDATVQGQILHNKWQDDWVFEGLAGDEITILMVRTSSDLDALLILYDANGNPLISCNDVSDGGELAPTDAIIIFTLPADGLYTIRATRYDREFGTTFGNYDLTLMRELRPGESMPIDIVGPGLQQTIMCNTVVTGSTIGSNGVWRDVWLFDAQGGQLVDLSMAATSGDLDSYIQVFDPLGNLIAEDDDGAGFPDAWMSVTFPATEQYQIVATRAGQEVGISSGTYELAIGCVGSAPAPGGGGNPPAAQPAQPPAVPPSGVIDQGYVFCGDTMLGAVTADTWYNQWYFDGTAGQDLILSLTRNAGDLDPFLVLIQPDGTWITDDDSGGGASGLAAQIYLTLPQTGTYTIQTTRAGMDQGITTGTYQLGVVCP